MRRVRRCARNIRQSNRDAIRSSTMPDSLRSRPVRRLPDTVRFTGRALYLTDDPTVVRSQLAGADLAWDRTNPAHALRDDISTDEITPAYICFYFDETLGDFPYL